MSFEQPEIISGETPEQVAKRLAGDLALTSLESDVQINQKQPEQSECVSSPVSLQRQVRENAHFDGDHAEQVREFQRHEVSRIRDGYDRAFSREQIENLARLENAARDIQNETEAALKALGPDSETANAEKCEKLKIRLVSLRDSGFVSAGMPKGYTLWEGSPMIHSDGFQFIERKNDSSTRRAFGITAVAGGGMGGGRTKFTSVADSEYKKEVEALYREIELRAGVSFRTLIGDKEQWL